MEALENHARLGENLFCAVTPFYAKDRDEAKTLAEKQFEICKGKSLVEIKDIRKVRGSETIFLISYTYKTNTE